MVEPKSMELLISRLVHDLASPLGAVFNGLELIEEEQDPDIQKEALGLSQRSCKRATDLVALFRMAYGAAGKHPGFTMKNALQLAKDWMVGSRVSLVDGEDVPNAQARLMLQLILIGFETMPRGGHLQPLLGPTLLLQGQRGGTIDDLRRALSGEVIDYTARTVPIYFAVAEAKSAGLVIQLVEESDQQALLKAVSL